MGVGTDQADARTDNTCNCIGSHIHKQLFPEQAAHIFTERSFNAAFTEGFHYPCGRFMQTGGGTDVGDAFTGMLA